MISRLSLCLGVLLGLPSDSSAAEKAKIVFLSGAPSHARMEHEHRAGNMILAEALERSGLSVEPYVVPDYGYPKDEKVLQDAATVVIFCTGHSGHLLKPHLDAFDALMQKGTGVVMIHWATEAEKGKMGQKFLEWMGGFCDLDWSVNPHWQPTFDDLPQHPICNGVKPFRVHDEWYYHMRFPEDKQGLTPILADLPPADTLRRPDGPRSGNPTVRQSVAAGNKQTVAWAYQRPSGGRGFGFTGAHNHTSWRDEGFRKIVLNAILWTARVEVPPDGCPSSPIGEQQIEKNLDPVATGPVTAQQIIASMDQNGDGKVSADEATDGVKSFFDNLDANNDGVLDRKEAQVIADYANNQRAAQQPKVEAPSAEAEGKALRLLVATLGNVQQARNQSALLEGILAGLSGRRDVTPPAAWPRVAANLAKSRDATVRELTAELSRVFGDEAAIARALATVQDKSAAVAQRRRALHSLLTQKNQEVVGLLEPLLEEPSLRLDAIRGFAAIESADAPSILLSQYAESEEQARKAIVETLATRRPYAVALLDAVKANRVAKADVPAHVARSLDLILGEAVVEVLGDVRKLAEDRTTLINKYKQLITADALEEAEASRGRAIFDKTCGSCHQMYGSGGKIGPDLTGSNRANLDYILLNSVDPSYDVPAGYKMVIIETVDGRILNGVVAEEDGQRVVLKTVEQPRAVILKKDIEHRQVSPKSIMPDGQFEQLKPQELLDLIKYLQTVEQVEVGQ